MEFLSYSGENLLEKFISVLIYLSIAVIIIVFHEMGHYLFGRLIGIPRSRLSIQLLKMPPHVALVNDNDVKIPPSNINKYVELLERFIKSDNKLFIYVIGGHALEIIIILAIVLISLITKVTFIITFAHAITWIAPLLALNYLLIDLFSTIRNKSPSGCDFSASWQIAYYKSTIFYLIYFASLLTAYIIVRL